LNLDKRCTEVSRNFVSGTGMTSNPNEIINGRSDKAFCDYLLAEYDNIAQAHFKTMETISTFFKHYLVIMSIPITFLIISLNVFSEKGKGFETSISHLGLFPLIILLIVSLSGLGVLIYIINLRMDAILYARTINGIRKYFYDNSSLNVGEGLFMRVLPQTTHLPPYSENRYFLPVVLTFALLDGFYLFSAVCIYPLIHQTTAIRKPIEMMWPYGVSIAGCFALIHAIIYWRYGLYREHGYLRSFIVGVDIDGVLNRHRDHFCMLLEKNSNIKVKPDDITTIPVHEDQRLGVSEQEARKVFNDPRYWIEMPPIENVAKPIKKLRNIFKFKIYIFTFRDWPQLFDYAEKESNEIKLNWKNALEELTRIVKPSFSLRAYWKFRRMREIDIITYLWLRKHKIEFDAFVIEKGTENASDPRGKFRNRFYISRRKNIRLFVEDDVEKAHKLAYVCEIVFLINQPYNKYANGLPKNVIRVDSWDEIYRWIRKLS
jgi:uncharacterized HAD superfamily protein